MQTCDYNLQANNSSTDFEKEQPQPEKKREEKYALKVGHLTLPN